MSSNDSEKQYVSTIGFFQIGETRTKMPFMAANQPWKRKRKITIMLFFLNKTIFVEKLFLI